MVFIHVFFCSSQWFLALAIPHAVAYGLTLNGLEDTRGMHLRCLWGVGHSGKPNSPIPCTLYTSYLSVSRPVGQILVHREQIGLCSND